MTLPCGPNRLDLLRAQALNATQWQVLVGRLRVESVAERLEMADLLGNKYFKAALALKSWLNGLADGGIEHAESMPQKSSV